ncbi:MAG: hypothetical protein ACI8ZN_000951 [Bacteroidia bacterium]|jgi:hypothetical protein
MLYYDYSRIGDLGVYVSISGVGTDDDSKARMVGRPSNKALGFPTKHVH